MLIRLRTNSNSDISIAGQDSVSRNATDRDTLLQFGIHNLPELQSRKRNRNSHPYPTDDSAHYQPITQVELTNTEAIGV